MRQLYFLTPGLKRVTIGSLEMAYHVLIAGFGDFRLQGLERRGEKALEPLSISIKMAQIPLICTSLQQPWNEITIHNKRSASSF